MTADGVASITDSPSLSLLSSSLAAAAGAGGGPDDAGGDGDDGSEPSPSLSRSSFPAALSCVGPEPGGRRATGGGEGGGQGQGRGGDGAAASSSSPSPTNADSVGGSSRHVGNSPSGADEIPAPPIRLIVVGSPTSPGWWRREVEEQREGETVAAQQQVEPMEVNLGAPDCEEIYNKFLTEELPLDDDVGI